MANTISWEGHVNPDTTTRLPEWLKQKQRQGQGLMRPQAPAPVLAAEISQDHSSGKQRGQGQGRRGACSFLFLVTTLFRFNSLEG